MAKKELIWAGQDANKYSRELIGGKGLNLLKLYSFAQQTGKVTVPNFFIMPTNYPNMFGSHLLFNDETELKAAFEKLNKPIIARSSSPAEDGLNASFAGKFLSLPDQREYSQLLESLNEIEHSANNYSVRAYVDKMQINYFYDMAFIAQEQVTDFLEKGVIQLEETEGVIEIESKKGGKWSHDINYNFLNESGPWKTWEEPHDYISEGEIHNATQCARDATKFLGLEGIVQVEFLLTPAKKPYFVQIRQLPKIKPHQECLDLKVPKDVPYIESEVCNGVGGDLTLPAYVTFSESGFNRILIESGCKSQDERMELFHKESKLPLSDEFHNAMNFSYARLFDSRVALKGFEKMWAQGNSLFNDYILVCDKLDESICGMNELTTNKRAIITCLEAQKTSHAMTVARELGIPAMGYHGDVMDLKSFYNQIESGDLVRLKSDGKQAVAYIEKKREKDPYEVNEYGK